jgi:exopolyphosphatase/pppGpp-phosphohydrolase
MGYSGSYPRAWAEVFTGSTSLGRGWPIKTRCHCGITCGGLQRLSLRLLEAGHVNQLRLAGLQTHRLSSLPGGLVVMLSAFKVFGLSQMTPSEAGLRGGVLHGLMARH